MFQSTLHLMFGKIASCKPAQAKWPAMLLLLTAVSGLAGCYDYRSGKHWNVAGDSDWQQVSTVKWINNTCRWPATISTSHAREGYVHSLFLIPLGLGGSAKNPKTTGFFVIGEGLSGRCNNAALVVSVNGREQTDTQVSACLKAKDCCAVDVPLSRDDIDSLQVEINDSDANCTYAPLVLKSRRHFCLRATEFGGSDGCDY